MKPSRYAAVTEALAAAGFHHTFEDTFDCKLSGVRSRCRLICVKRRIDGWFSGPSFWIHLSGKYLHLGLWSGQLFRTERVQQGPELVVELMKRSKKIPTKLPRGMARRYCLTEVED